MRCSKPVAFFVVLCLLGGGGCAHHHHHHHAEGSLALDDLPAPVREHFNRDHPNVIVKTIQPETQGQVTRYDIKYEDQGLMEDAVYDLNGDEIKPDATLP